MISPEIGTISDNDIRFTSEALIAALVNFKDELPLGMQVWLNDRLNAIEACQNEPGLLTRCPGNLLQEGPDDYYAASTIGYLFHRPIAQNIYNYGISHWGMFKNNPDTPWYKAMLWRQPALYIHAKHCAGFKISIAEQSILAFSILLSARSTEQDPKMLMWFVIKAVNGKYAIVDSAISYWRKKLIEHYGSIGRLLGKYYHPAHESHPNSKYLWLETGE